MTDQSIPEVLRGKATSIFAGPSPAAPPGHVIAMSDVGSKVYLIRCGEVVGRVERRAGVSYMYLGSGTTGGLYRGAHGDTTAALALIAEAAERGRAAAAASAGPAPEPEPSWLPWLRGGMRDTVSQTVYGSDFDLPPHLTRVVDAVTAHAAAYLRPLHAELAEANRELDAVRASLRARDARLARQDEEIDSLHAAQAEYEVMRARVVWQAAEIDELRERVARQAGAIVRPKVAPATSEHLPASATAEAYLGEENAPSPEMREVPAGEWRDGDTIRGIWHQHAAQSGKGGLLFAESRMGGLTEVMATRPVAPLPKAPGSVGTATVQGRKGIRVMLAPRSDKDLSPWSSATRVASRFFHAAEEIADYVPELDGQEGN